MPQKAESSRSNVPTDECDTLRQVIDDLQRRIEENCEPNGPIRQALLPSLRASIEVLSALIEDGQPELAAEVLEPVAKEVDRIIQRGY